jgi:anthranilate synthase component 1
LIQEFSEQFKSEKQIQIHQQWLFGYISYDAVRYFEKVTLKKRKQQHHS